MKNPKTSKKSIVTMSAIRSILELRTIPSSYEDPIPQAKHEAISSTNFLMEIDDVDQAEI